MQCNQGAAHMANSSAKLPPIGSSNQSLSCTRTQEKPEPQCLKNNAIMLRVMVVLQMYLLLGKNAPRDILLLSYQHDAVVDLRVSSSKGKSWTRVEQKPDPVAGWESSGGTDTWTEWVFVNGRFIQRWVDSLGALIYSLAMVWTSQYVGLRKEWYGYSNRAFCLESSMTIESLASIEVWSLSLVFLRESTWWKYRWPWHEQHSTPQLIVYLNMCLWSERGDVGGYWWRAFHGQYINLCKPDLSLCMQKFLGEKTMGVPPLFQRF